MKIEVGLGARIRELRKSRGITLRQLGERTGYTHSALSKMETGQLGLTYDKLAKLSAALDMGIGSLLVDGPQTASPVTARRSISRRGDGRRVETEQYTYRYLSPELSRKQHTPIISTCIARSLQAFGPLIRHKGEEWIYVLSGEIEVHTEFYEPERLGVGDSIYIDSTMGHAYITVSDEIAQIISVSSESEEEYKEGRETDAGAQ